MGIREFVELSAPLQFLIQFVVMRWTQPRYNSLVCSLSDDEFRTALLYLGTDIAVEAFVCLCTYSILRKLGFSPLRILRGLFSMHFGPFLVAASAITMYFGTLQHSHWGFDTTFSFPWLDGARWE